MSQLINALAASLRENWEKPALSDFKGASFTNAEVARRIATMHILFQIGRAHV